MKVLVIGPSPTKSKGGMATVIRGISEDSNLNQMFDIDIFESYIDGSKIIRLLYTIYSYLKFCTIYKKYDLFHVHMASYGSTFRKAFYISTLKRHGKKVIVHIHGASYLVFFDKLKQEKKQCVIDTLKSADMVIALSDKWKESFVSTFGLTNCVSLNNGINIDEFAGARSDTIRYKDSFLFLGRLGTRKGAYDLIEAIDRAAKKGVNITCYMAGDGEIQKVKAIIKEKQLENHIIINGWVDFEGKIELLKKVSTVVLPSYNEGLPMAILEGMASQKAIITTRVGAIPEVVKDGENGFVIEPGNIDALTAALISCSNNVNILERMALNNSLKINNEFSRKYINGKLAVYYKNFLNRCEYE
ncbi:MAG: glycosyltransferase family 4 protein [Anaerocolumna sp.]